MYERLNVIRDACEWVSSKGRDSRDACKVSLSVKWADWDKKLFSPAMCVLWHNEVLKGGGSYETFHIPSPEEWISRTASALGASNDWVRTFVEQCNMSTVDHEKWTASVTFDGLDGYQLKNPRIEWKKEQRFIQILPEVQYCREMFGLPEKKNALPYWTKNPPIGLYERKLIDAVRDLFEAREAHNVE